MSNILLIESRTGLTIQSVDASEPCGVRFDDGDGFNREIVVSRAAVDALAAAEGLDIYGDDAAEAALAYRAHLLSGMEAELGNGNTFWTVIGGIPRRSQATHGETFAGGPVTRQSEPKVVDMPRGGYEALASAREHIDAGAERVMFTRHRAEVPGNVGVGIGVDDSDPRQGWTVYPAGGRLAPRV
jgi:hypothetical protein